MLNFVFCIIALLYLEAAKRGFTPTPRTNNDNQDSGSWSKYLLDRWKAEEEKVAEEKADALQQLAEKCDLAGIDKLLNTGKWNNHGTDNLNQYSIKGYKLIDNFTLFSCKDVFQFLENRGLDINAISLNGNTPLANVIIENESLEAAKELLNLRADPNIIVSRGRNALTLAILYQREEIVNLLLEYDADPFYRYPEESYIIKNIAWRRIKLDKQSIGKIIDACLAKDNPDICLAELKPHHEIFGTALCE